MHTPLQPLIPQLVSIPSDQLNFINELAAEMARRGLGHARGSKSAALRALLFSVIQDAGGNSKAAAQSVATALWGPPKGAPVGTSGTGVVG